jgi:transcriptional regulator with XRE-family HTH domain
LSKDTLPVIRGARKLLRIPYSTVIGRDLREFRNSRNWSEKRFAELLGIPKSDLQELESGSCQELVPDPVPSLIAKRFSELVFSFANRSRAGRPPKAFGERRNYSIGAEVEVERWATFHRFIEERRSLPKGTRVKKHLLKTALTARGFSNEEIEAGLSARTPLIAARNLVAARRNLHFSTIAKYHREFLKAESSI